MMYGVIQFRLCRFRAETNQRARDCTWDCFHIHHRDDSETSYTAEYIQQLCTIMSHVHTMTNSGDRSSLVLSFTTPSANLFSVDIPLIIGSKVNIQMFTAAAEQEHGKLCSDQTCSALSAELLQILHMTKTYLTQTKFVS